MEKFRRKMMSIELLFTCVNEEYFVVHFRDYYDYLGFELCKSEEYGLYGKYYYKLKTASDILFLGLDKDFYNKLPSYICTSDIY